MAAPRWIRRLVPGALRRRAALALAEPPVGSVAWGDLGRLTPISKEWGFDRGRPIDRYYIEEFLATHASDIAGDVLEIDAPTYTRRFGGDRVRRSEVLHIEEDRPEVTIVGDLTQLEDFEAEQFDCVILTQTLQVIYDAAAAVATCHHVLRPGGVLLATFPGISKISRADMDRWGYHWSFTSRSAARMFGDVFGADNVELETVGNVLVTTAFLYGLVEKDVAPEDLAYHDPDYELLIRLRATRGDAGR